MNRTKRFFSNMVSTACLRIVMMMVGFIVPRLLLVSYGSEVNGLISSVTQFINYFTLVEAGLSGATVYALYKPLVENDIPGINGIVSAANHFYLQAGWMFCGLVGALTVLYPLFVVQPHSMAKIEVGLLVVVIGCKGAMEFFTLAKYRALLTADQKTYIISLTSMLYHLIFTAIIVVFTRIGMAVVFVYLLSATAIIVRSVILFVYVRNQYAYLDYKVEPNTKALDKKWDALFLQILGMIYTGAPVVILTVITRDLKIVSVYTIFNMVLLGINNLLGMFSGGLSASFGEIIARNETNTLQCSYREFETAYSILHTIVYAVAYVMIVSFVQVYTANVSDVSYAQPLIGALFVINGLLYSLRAPQAMLIISAGMYKETKWRTVMQGLISAGGGLVLCYFFGIVGIMIAQIASNIYRDIDLLIFVPRYITKLPIRNTLKKWICMLVSAVLIWAIAGRFDLNPSGYLQWARYATAVTALSVVVVLVVFGIFERATLRRILHRVVSLFWKKGVRNA